MNEPAPASSGSPASERDASHARPDRKSPHSPAGFTRGGRRRLNRTLAHALAAGILLYFAGAYVALPEFWKVYVREHPKFADVPGVTHTATGVPGDPLNVALVLDDPDPTRLMAAAGWRKADPLSLRHDLRIAEAAVLGRPYAEAPVSDLFLFGRREDVAYEQAVGDNPRQRHHVRFWKTAEKTETGRAVWIGSAVFDQHVGLSRDTGQITHVTSPNVDAERDKLLADLRATGRLEESYYVPDFHISRSGFNGGGDLWTTDGRLAVAVELPAASPDATSPSGK